MPLDHAWLVILVLHLLSGVYLALTSEISFISVLEDAEALACLYL